MAMEVLWERRALTNSTIIKGTKRVSLTVALMVVLMVEVPLVVPHLEVLPHRECMRRT
jgi:hypothetical protein